MDGSHAARAARGLLHVLSSGYAHAAIDLSPQSRVHFLQKPHAFEDVQGVLEEALAAPDRSAG